MILQDLVRAKIQEIGTEAAAGFFGVSEARIKQWLTGSKPINLPAVEKVFDPEKFSQQKPVDAAWSGRQVAICLPVYREFHPLTNFCLMALLEREKMRVFTLSGDAFIAHCRNSLTAQFLDSETEWSFWLDSDLIVPIGNAGWFTRTTGFVMPDKFASFHTINRLMSHGKTLVGGVYYGRAPNGGKPLYSEAYHDAAEEKWIRSGPHDKIKPTRWIAAGCLLAHRKVFEDISAKFPHLHGHWWSSSEHDLVVKAKEAAAVLENANSPFDARARDAHALLKLGLATSERNSKMGMGEDVQLCIRAQQAGHTPHVDCGLLCGHVGGAVYGPKIKFL